MDSIAFDVIAGSGLGAFFAFARERHSVYLKRAAGQTKPWTSDIILQSHRFTNVFRELDRTTVWFRRNVRGTLAGRPEVLLATVVFRWFNRIETGQAVFCQPDLGGRTAFDRLVTGGRAREELTKPILDLIGSTGPYVTGAYTINTISAGLGYSKLEGVLILIDRWVREHPDWRGQAAAWKDGGTLRAAWEYLHGACHGDFMCYEVACDLRYTDLLRHAPDVNTWANAGPGAVRGLNRIHGRQVKGGLRQEVALHEMRELLALSRREESWPSKWPSWELREVEHTLCEFDKYKRVQEGMGRPRGSFQGKGPP